MNDTILIPYTSGRISIMKELIGSEDQTLLSTRFENKKDLRRILQDYEGSGLAVNVVFDEMEG